MKVRSLAAEEASGLRLFSSGWAVMSYEEGIEVRNRMERSPKKR